MNRRIQFRLNTLLLLMATFAVVIVLAQVSWRYFHTDMRWRSFSEAGALRRSAAGTVLSPQYEIDISDNPRLQDSDLETLSGLSTIYHLDASNTPLTDQCLRHLGTLRNLRSMDISGTRISQQGARELSKSLPDCAIRH